MKKILVGVIAMVSINLAFADEKNLWHVSLGAGNTHYKESTFDASDNFLSLSGGYLINENLRFEASYTNLGSVKGRLGQSVIEPNILALDTEGFTLSAVIGWNLTDSFILSGKLGVSILDVEKQWSGGTFFPPEFANDTGGTSTDFYIGMRLEYQLDQTFSVGINWDRYDVENIDVDGLYANLSYSF